MSGKDRSSKASSSRNSAGPSSSISSSFLGLKAELERSKASSSSLASSSSKRKSDDLDRPSRRKLSSTFLASTSSDKPKRSKLNETIPSYRSKRSASDDPSASQLERIKHNLERKARIYSQLESGKYGGFTSAELKEGSIDWDRKRSEPPPIRALSPSPPLNEDKDEREVEYVDEFGRTRKSRVSEVPREFLAKEYGGDLEDEVGEEEDNAIYGPSTSFPVYNPEAHRRERYAQEEARGKHFDPDFDRRHRGAAFYRFSDKEDERKVQLDQLAELRNETRRNRNELD